MDLTPEERQRIYQEERARIEASERARADLLSEGRIPEPAADAFRREFVAARRDTRKGMKIFIIFPTACLAILMLLIGSWFAILPIGVIAAVALAKGPDD